MTRVVLALAAVAPLFAVCATAAPQRCQRLYVGTQASGPGIYTTVLDTQNGKLSPLRPVAQAPRATWLAADPTRRLLYAVSDPRDQPGAAAAILSFRVDPASGDLVPLASIPPGGAGPTYLALDRQSRTLFVALYGAGQATALPAASNGTLEAPVSRVQNAGTGPSPRQTAPHAHAVVLDPTGRWLLVPDLGADRVFVYRFDPATRQLEPAPRPFLQMPTGSGPRHLTFGRDGRHAYLVSELSGTVSVLGWAARVGVLTLEQTLSLEPPTYVGPRSGAEIVLSRDGRTLRVSDRADHSIVSFVVAARTGHLTETGRVASGGRTPWSFAIDPGGRWMVVANQGSDTVDALPLAGAIGTGKGSVTLAKPVAVVFAGTARTCS